MNVTKAARLNKYLSNFIEIELEQWRIKRIENRLTKSMFISNCFVYNAIVAYIKICKK